MAETLVQLTTLSDPVVSTVWSVPDDQIENLQRYLADRFGESITGMIGDVPGLATAVDHIIWEPR